MNIFLSYSSQQLGAAEEIAMGLRAEGHEVFFDQVSLAPGDAYNHHIRRAIENADCFVALLSPGFVSGGRYTLSELELVQDKWPNPVGRVLPVMVEPVPIAQVPTYLRAVTILEPKGNLTADVISALHAIERGKGWRQTRRQILRFGVGVAAVAAAAFVGMLGWRWAEAAPLRPGFDFLDRQAIEDARWSNGHQRLRLLVDDVPRQPPEVGDVRFFARSIRLENGSNASNVLHTHPQWVSHGRIEGAYGPFTVGDGLRLRGQVGFTFRSGGGGDGVLYRILFRPLLPGSDLEIWSLNKSNNGHLEAINQDLQRVAGKVGYIVLEVNAKEDSGADWADWVSLKVN
jgi:TIR domain